MTLEEFLTHPAFLWTIFGLVVSGLLLWIISYFVASYLVYTITLSRGSKDRWGRDMPKEIDPEQIPMYEMGLKWAEENADKCKEIHIVNDGLNLYGEYYDFGSDKCVIVLSGRTESLKYGYYFGIPYARNGFNVVVLDPRAHGNSDGEYNTVGFEESKDDLAWVKYLEKEFNLKTIVFHGICIGAAGGMYAITNKDCPDCVKGIVTEGMFANFKESVKNHLIEKKKPVRGMLNLIDKWMVKYTGHSMSKGPIDIIDQLDKPLLMLHSKEDKYSLPEFAQKLYDKAGSKNKRIVWFEHGKHSMLRIRDTELYDNSITEFLKENIE